MMNRPQRFLTVLVVFSLTISLLLANAGSRSIQAGESNIRISQVYGGGGNSGATLTNDFIEIFNPTGSPISLAGWTVQYAASTGSSWQPTALSGSIAAYSYYLVQEAAGSGGTTPLPSPDATGSIAMSATNGKVALVNSTTALSGTCPTDTSIIDFVGYGSANCYEGSGAAPVLSNTTANLRLNGGCTDTDVNSADFETVSPIPRNSSSPTNTCGVIVDTPPSITSVTPQNNSGGVALASDLSLTFDEEVTVNDPFFSISCTSSGTHTAQATTSDNISFTLNPDVDFVKNETCTVTVNAADVADVDGTPDNMVSDYTWQFTTTACGLAFTPIHDIQGSGAVSPLVGQTVVVEGIVSVVNSEFGGYFMQSSEYDENEDTSEGIFVYDQSHQAETGDLVRLTGIVAEYSSSSPGRQALMTELNSLTSFESCSVAELPVNSVVVNLPGDSDPSLFLEKYEGMLVTFPETLTVQQNYFQGRFGQVSLGAEGRIFNPNNGQGGDTTSNIQRMIILDDGSHEQNPNPIPYYTVDGALRAGDTVTGLIGVVDQGRINSSTSGTEFPDVFYRLHPIYSPYFVQVNSRTSSETPPTVGGQIKVAGFNVLNYFTTLDVSPFSPPYDTVNRPRGADSQLELDRQTDKLVAALQALDADVVGLVEIESWADADAVNALVNALNTAIGSSVYAAVPDPAGFPYPPTDGDFIKVALIYKTASVAPVGDSMMDVNDVYSRTPVAQTFSTMAGGDVFSVVVNHFKSKGSCPIDPIEEPNFDHGQGCWNALRIQQAEQLLTFIDTIVTSSGDPDVVVVGDLNAYGIEDPIITLTDGGLVNQVAAKIPLDDQYSYIFDGQSGYLDHLLTTASLSNQVADAGFWHINADETSVIDYNTEFKTVDLYEAHIFRASDHDPAVLGLFPHLLFMPTISR